MKTRTWEYGTEKNAIVLSTEKAITLLEDENGEGHVLMGTNYSDKVNPGDSVVLRFCKGGPTGGYWKINEVKKTEEEK